ncbi:TPA: gp53-like domain-containing protein, partial [Escherichia coli]
MHRIDTKTAQKDKFGAGKNGFTRGNPQTGTPATDLDDDYFDMLQEELCSVVEASGASLEKARHDQLLTALRALLLSRKNPFGDIKSDGTVKTALENLGLGDLGTASGRNVGNTQSFEIPDMSYFQLTGKGSDNLLAKLPNGLIIQVFRRRLSNSTTIGIPTTIP